MTTSYEENPCWEGFEDFQGFGEVVEDFYDDEDLHDESKCEYCQKEPWLFPGGEPHYDPFSWPHKKIVCKDCFIQIIGGDEE